jgi:hypothetical protein
MTPAEMDKFLQEENQRGLALALGTKEIQITMLQSQVALLKRQLEELQSRRDGQPVGPVEARGRE